MPGAGVNGKETPSNDGAGYDSVAFTSTGEEQRVPPLGTETDSIAIRALPSNGGIIYVGFDDNVSSSNGYPLTAGDSLTFDLDANQQGLFVVANTVGDEIRWIALS